MHVFGRKAIKNVLRWNKQQSRLLETVVDRCYSLNSIISASYFKCLFDISRASAASRRSSKKTDGKKKESLSISTPTLLAMILLKVSLLAKKKG